MHTGEVRLNAYRGSLNAQHSSAMVTMFCVITAGSCAVALMCNCTPTYVF